ncbi:MAG: hypothetical protein FWE70_01490, partial [Oscillospiraceae bacterium]|nr:hypothetical protein [Oscillospiraceae bacterium]
MGEGRLHFIGNAHLDPIWLWRWQEGFAEVKATFRSALDRMREYPDFIFTCSSAQYYRWVEENCPELFAEVAERVREGRWKVVGGWWVQADTNIPSGEALARHGLYSQRYYLDRFGMTCKVGYNVDSFGHSASLPQILKKSGMDCYVFKNPQKGEFPTAFNWVGTDGSSVVAYKIQDTYMSWDGYPHWSSDRGSELRKKAAAAKALSDGLDMGVMVFYGVGNHGGGPTIAHIDEIIRMRGGNGGERCAFSSPEEYFREVDPAALPTYAKELNHAATGGYSAKSELKAMNRRAEHRLLEAERYNVLADALTGCGLRTARLREAWENVMLIHFHDAICGVSIKPAYPDMAEFHGESLSAAAKVMNHSLQSVSWAVNTARAPEVRKDKEDDLRVWEKGGLGAPLVVFNPLSWDADLPIEVNKTVRRVEGPEGDALEIQHVKGWHAQDDFDRWHTLFRGKVPALGYATYWIYRDFGKPERKPETLGKDPLILENDKVRIRFEGHTGYISEYVDKGTGQGFLRGRGAVPLVIDEHYANNWGGDYTDVMARFSDATFESLEDGPIRRRVRVVSRHNRSEVRQDFILHEGSPDLEVRVRVAWLEGGRMLKLSYRLNADHACLIHETPYGSVAKAGTGGEECCGQWAELCGLDGPNVLSLAIANDCKYGVSALGDEIRLTALRSPVHSDGGSEGRDAYNEYTDIGLHEFRYTVMPNMVGPCGPGGQGAAGPDGAGFGGPGDPRFGAAMLAARAESVRKAFELNVPLSQIVETYHEGPLPQRYGGLRVSAANVAVTALKESEDGSAYVLRCYETVGL